MLRSRTSANTINQLKEVTHCLCSYPSRTSVTSAHVSVKIRGHCSFSEWSRSGTGARDIPAGNRQQKVVVATSSTPDSLQVLSPTRVALPSRSSEERGRVLAALPPAIFQLHVVPPPHSRIRTPHFIRENSEVRRELPRLKIFSINGCLTAGGTAGLLAVQLLPSARHRRSCRREGFPEALLVSRKAVMSSK